MTTAPTYHPTAIARKALSAPVAYLKAQGVFSTAPTILDFGSGRGYDAEALGADSYDPNGPNPYCPSGPYHRVLCIYVLNVVPLRDQKLILTTLKGLVARGGTVHVAVRRDIPETGTSTQFWVRDEVMELHGYELLHRKKKQFDLYQFYNPK